MTRQCSEALLQKDWPVQTNGKKLFKQVAVLLHLLAIVLFIQNSQIWKQGRTCPQFRKKTSGLLEKAFFPGLLSGQLHTSEKRRLELRGGFFHILYVFFYYLFWMLLWNSYIVYIKETRNRKCINNFVLFLYICFSHRATAAYFK